MYVYLLVFINLSLAKFPGIHTYVCTCYRPPIHKHPDYICGKETLLSYGHLRTKEYMIKYPLLIKSITHMHTHKLTSSSGGGRCCEGCWGVNRGREHTYIHTYLQWYKEVDNKLRTIEQMWTIMVNWCGWVSNLKAFGMALQMMLVTASELSPFSQTPPLPSLAAMFSNCICEVVHK